MQNVKCVLVTIIIIINVMFDNKLLIVGYHYIMKAFKHVAVK